MIAVLLIFAANLIVIGRARRVVRITSPEYLKVGVPLSVLPPLFGAFFPGRR
jgi:hypothetical protein